MFVILSFQNIQESSTIRVTHAPLLNSTGQVNGSLLFFALFTIKKPFNMALEPEKN